MSSLRTLTTAAGMLFPVGSVTTPVTVARSARWARTEAAAASRRADKQIGLLTKRRLMAFLQASVCAYSVGHIGWTNVPSWELYHMFLLGSIRKLTLSRQSRNVPFSGKVEMSPLARSCEYEARHSLI